MPRGVLWRQEDLFLASNTTNDAETADYAHLAGRLTGEAPVLPGARPGSGACKRLEAPKKL